MKKKKNDNKINLLWNFLPFLIFQVLFWTAMWLLDGDCRSLPEADQGGCGLGYTFVFVIFPVWVIVSLILFIPFFAGVMMLLELILSKIISSKRKTKI